MEVPLIPGAFPQTSLPCFMYAELPPNGSCFPRAPGKLGLGVFINLQAALSTHLPADSDH